MTSSAIHTDAPFRTHWPFALGGLLFPLATLGLTRWMPQFVAVAIAAFVLWTLAFLLFTRISPTTGRSAGRSLAIAVGAALAAAAVSGTVAYLLPWA